MTSARTIRPWPVEGRSAPVVGGMASLGAGAIHAAAVGVHGDHRAAAITFAVIATFQLVWGAVALARSGALVTFGGAAGNLGLLGGFVLAKTRGIGFVDGLEVAEPVRFADGAAAALALLAAGASVAALAATRAGRRPQASVVSSPGRLARAATPAVAVALAALTAPAMVAVGAHGHTGDVAGHPHQRGGPEAAASVSPAVVPPRPYDPTKPIDLSGVEGVTPEQQARAENLIAITLLRLPAFADPATAEAAGFRSIGDGFTGHEHFINWAYLDDGRFLDPDHPESLVYETYRDGRPRKLVAAMFMLGSQDTLDDVPDIGGPLTQWHVHRDLCFTDEPGNYKVRGLVRPDGTCAPPLVQPAQGPMIHVWTIPHPCGPFASLEGVAGGQIKPGETRLCDHAHGAADGAPPA